MAHESPQLFDLCVCLAVGHELNPESFNAERLWPLRGRRGSRNHGLDRNGGALGEISLHGGRGRGNRDHGNPSNEGGHRRLWLPVREQSFDFVRTPMASCSDQLRTVGLSQLRCEQPNRSEVQLSGAQGLQDLRMTSRRAGCLDSFVSDPLGEMKHALAIAEHRGASLLEIQPSRVDFTEVCDQIGFECVTRLDEPPHPGEQLSTRKPGE